MNGCSSYAHIISQCDYQNRVNGNCTLNTPHSFLEVGCKANLSSKLQTKKIAVVKTCSSNAGFTHLNIISRDSADHGSTASSHVGGFEVEEAWGAIASALWPAGTEGHGR